MALKRTATAAVFVLFMFLGAAAHLPAAASPFNDVPADRSSCDALQSLAADGLVRGYPTARICAGAPMSRAEIARLISLALAKVEEDGASRSDLVSLRALMSQYKDELGALGVRTAAVEDRFSSLDRTTQFAQRFSVHGSFSSSYSQREILQNPLLVSGALAREDPVQRFTDAYIETDSSNDPYYGANDPGVLLPRSQWEFTAQYAATPNLIVSLPVKLIDFAQAGYRNRGLGVGVNPTIEVSVPNAGQVQGLDLRLGQLENLRGSLTGLAYSPPDNFHAQYKDPFRPFPEGGDVSGTAARYVDFQLFGFRLDPVAINTSPFPPNAGSGSTSYLGPYYFQQTSNVYGSTPTTDTFSAGSAPLQSVALTQNGQPATMYVSYFSGPGCPAGCFFSGPNQPGEPAFSFVQAANQLVFASPLPPGSTVAVSYQGFTVANNTFAQRFDAGGRLVYHTPGLAGGAIGVTFNRIFDLPGDSGYFSQPALPQSLVGDTVFGIDFTVPLAASIGVFKTPSLFGELASSRYTKDTTLLPYAADSASVVGLRFRILGGDQTLTYQDVGSNYIDGAPFQYSGQSPALFAAWTAPQLPGPFGIGNDAALNAKVDAIAAANGFSGPLLGANPSFPYGTFAFPLFNQFKAQGPYFYSSYAPNTRGGSAQLNFPLIVGKVDARLRIGGQMLREVQPNALADHAFGLNYPTRQRATYAQVASGVTLGLPLLNRRATISLDALYESLRRNDRSPFVYAADPALGLNAFNSLASAELAGSGARVLYYPNFSNLSHYYGAASVAVPLTSAVTANVAYVDQRYSGDAQTLTQSVSQKKTSLTTGVLYNIPNTNASVNLFFNRYAYRDNVLPSYDWVQNRQNLYFTVKF
ncbi:MAG: hypothetical protein GIW99_05680 [Candidatus Eremiobacteraeota bacterium]|nr:hypothetical protein [Candidatus Eremiobacteraeota bacterium]MBC5827158.1 hypothetical protein [Candidatus Eremiobacteraeota bacterium]